MIAYDCLRLVDDAGLAHVSWHVGHSACSSQIRNVSARAAGSAACCFSESFPTDPCRAGLYRSVMLGCLYDVTFLHLAQVLVLWGSDLAVDGLCSRAAHCEHERYASEGNTYDSCFIDS